MSDRRGSVRTVAAPLLGLAVLGLVWESAVRIFDVKPTILRAPSQIVAELVSDPTPYLSGMWTTAWHTIVGAGIALVLSLFVGGLLASSRFLDEAVQPILILILVTPWVAYVTSLVVWLGAGTRPALFLVAFVSLPGFVFAMVAGLRSADPAARELFASVDASAWETLWRLRLPSALPTLFAAARLNTGLALASAYFVEGANLANGSLGQIGRSAANSPAGGNALWVTIVLTALLGVLILASVTGLERIVLKWHASQR